MSTPPVPRSTTKGSRLASPFLNPPPSFTLPSSNERSESPSLESFSSHNAFSGETEGEQEYTILAGGPERSSSSDSSSESSGESEYAAPSRKQVSNGEENETFYSFDSSNRNLSNERDQDRSILDIAQAVPILNRFSPIVVEEAKAKYMSLIDRAKVLAIRGTKDALAEAVALLTTNPPWEEVEWHSLYESYTTACGELTRTTALLHRSERSKIRLVKEKDQLYLQVEQLQDELDDHIRKAAIKAPVLAREPIIAPGYSKEDFERLRDSYQQLKDHAANLMSQLSEAEETIADADLCISMALANQQELQRELLQRDAVQTLPSSRPISIAPNGTPKSKSLFDEGVFETSPGGDTGVGENVSTAGQSPAQDQPIVKWAHTSLTSIQSQPNTPNIITQEQLQVLRQRLNPATRNTYVSQGIQVSEVDLPCEPARSQKLWYKPVEEWASIEPCMISEVPENVPSIQESEKVEDPYHQFESPGRPKSPVRTYQVEVHTETGISIKDYPELEFPSSPEFQQQVKNPFSFSVDFTHVPTSLSCNTASCESLNSGLPISDSHAEPELKQSNSPNIAKSAHKSPTRVGKGKDNVSLIGDGTLLKIVQKQSIKLGKQRSLQRLSNMKSGPGIEDKKFLPKKTVTKSDKIVPSKLVIRRSKKEGSKKETGSATPDKLSSLPRLSRESITVLLRQLEKDQLESQALDSDYSPNHPHSKPRKGSRSVEEIRRSALRALEGMNTQVLKQKEQSEELGSETCFEKCVRMVESVVRHGQYLQIRTILYITISLWVLSVIYFPCWKWQEANQDYTRRDVTSWRQRTWRPEAPFGLPYMLEAAVSIWGRSMEPGWYA